MDSAGLNIMLRALSGNDATDPAVFADGVLRRLEAELGAIRESLLSDEPHVTRTADVVWAMEQRIEAAIDLLEQLRQKGAA